MRTQLPLRRLYAAAVALVLSVAMFAFLNQSFGGPGFAADDDYVLSATFADSQNLLKKSLVMVRGVKVGEVRSVTIRRGVARVRLTVEERYRPLRAGTRAQIGHRTIFGEPIVVLRPGPRRAAALPPGARLPALPTVEPDEALQVFAPRTRRELAAAAREIGDGLRPAQSATRLSATVDGLNATLGRLRAVTDALRGQQRPLGRLIDGGATVLAAIGRQEAALQRLIGSGRAVADTLAGRQAQLDRTLVALHAVTGTATSTLRTVRPLLLEAAPVAVRLTRTARVLAPAFAEVRPLARDTRILTGSLPAAGDVAAPVLRSARRVATGAGPLATLAVPATRNAEPILGYLGDHGRDLAGFMATGSDVVDQGDARGNWLRGFLVLDPAILFGRDGPCTPRFGGLCTNPYPAPGDAADPQPYAKGSFPQLRPFAP